MPMPSFGVSFLGSRRLGSLWLCGLGLCGLGLGGLGLLLLGVVVSVRSILFFHHDHVLIDVSGPSRGRVLLSSVYN